ncbi:MAG: multidrug effflux MFS transporter [Candidatus Dormiibacterota bacterium]
MALGALTAIGPLCIDAYLPGLPFLTRELHSNASLVQVTITACLFGLAAGQLVAGPLSDALGRRPPLVVGMVLFTIASGLCAAAPSVEVLIILRAIQGFTGAAGIVIARAIIRDRFSGSAIAHYFALLTLVNGVAPVVAPVFGAQVLRITSWRGIFLALAAVGVVLSVLAVRQTETLPPSRRRRGGLSASLAVMRRLAGDRVFVGYTLANGFVLGAMFAYISGSAYVLQEIYGLTPQLFSGLFALNAVGIMAASRVASLLAGRVPLRRLLAAGLTESALGGIVVLVSVLLHLGLPALLPGLFLVVSSVGLVMPTTMSLALADHGDNAGAASGALGLAQFLIGGAVAPLVGLSGGRSALLMAILIAALGISGGVICILLTGRHGALQAGVIP